MPKPVTLLGYEYAELPPSAQRYLLDNLRNDAFRHADAIARHDFISSLKRAVKMTEASVSFFPSFLVRCRGSAIAIAKAFKENPEGWMRGISVQYTASGSSQTLRIEHNVSPSDQGYDLANKGKELIRKHLKKHLPVVEQKANEATSNDQALIEQLSQHVYLNDGTRIDQEEVLQSIVGLTSKLSEIEDRLQTIENTFHSACRSCGR